MTPNLRKKILKPISRRRKLLHFQKETTLELPIRAEELTTHLFSSPKIDDTLERELLEHTQDKISANDIPVPGGSELTNYDGIQMTIMRLSQAFMAARSRLEWCGMYMASQEKVIFEKEKQIAKLSGNPPPKALAKIPFFSEPTNPGVPIIITKPMINRFIMGLVGALAGGFVLVCIILLIFAKPK